LYYFVMCPAGKSAVKQPKAGNNILTIRPLAGSLPSTERTVYRLAAARQIPISQVGGSWRFRRIDTERCVDAQTMHGHPGAAVIPSVASGTVFHGSGSSA